MPLMTDDEYPSLTSGTMTPMVKLRFERRVRARKLGRYLNLPAAAKIRSFVSWGMESATVDRLITSETVAGESPRYSASFFKLIGLRLTPAPCLSQCLRSAVSHKRNRGSRRVDGSVDGLAPPLLLTRRSQTLFHTLLWRLANAI